MRILTVVPFLTFAIAGEAALADLSECVSMDADLDRLACYDRVSGKTPNIGVVETNSDWDVQVQTSEFKDTTDVFLQVRSEDDLACGRLNNRPAVLWVRCLEDTTSVIISTDCHLTSSQYNDYGNVDLRIDDEPATTIAMEASTSNNSLGLWSGGQSIPFIKRMLGKEQLIARFTPFSESPVTARFNISGLDEALEPLRQSCAW